MGCSVMKWYETHASEQTKCTRRATESRRQARSQTESGNETEMVPAFPAATVIFLVAAVDQLWL